MIEGFCCPICDEIDFADEDDFFEHVSCCQPRDEDEGDEEE